MIAYLISAYTSLSKIERLINFLHSEKTIFLIHYNKKNINENLDLKKWISSLDKKNIYLIEPIDVYRSDFSHVKQKINAILYLYKNNIHFDYFISLTENDCPIKSRDKIEHFVEKNIDKTFFFDSQYSNVKMYYELEKGLPKSFSDIKRRLRIINNEIPLDNNICQKKWRYYIHPRNLLNRKNFNKKILIFFKSFWILLFIFFPSRNNFIRAQRFYFKKNKEVLFCKFYSEWQYSISSFFSKGYTDFIVNNYKKYEYFFKDIYAPDESFWITIAMDNIDKINSKIIFNWKPLILSLGGKTISRNNDELYLSWDIDNIDSIKKYNNTNELFCRRVDDNVFFKILGLIGDK